MKKAMFRQMYSTDGDVTVVGKIKEIPEGIVFENQKEKIEEFVEEQNKKKEEKKKNGRKFTI